MQRRPFSSSPHGDEPFPQGGQFIDMNFMAASNTCSKSSAGAPRRPWQRSLDSQEFGFASNLKDSTEVAPADELFYKGQLLPLQMDHRRYLVQALSSSSEQISPPVARAGSSRLVDDLCQDDEVIEFNSCRLEREASLASRHDYRLPNHAIFPLPAHCIKISKESSCYVPRDEKLKHCAELDYRACTRNDKVADRNGEHGILPLYEDEQLHSCNCNMSALDYKMATTNDSCLTADPGSSSFRSQNSGFWDSGTERDMMDSSSSRDSNGSSQDSYFHTHIKSAPFVSASHHHPHSKLLNFNIPWKFALFKKGSCRTQDVPQDSSIKVGFSEDLCKYKACVAPSLNEVKEALLPWKLERETNAQGSKREKQGKDERRLHSSAADDGCDIGNVMALCKSLTPVVCDAGAKKSLVQDGSTSKRFGVPTKSADAGTSLMDEEMKMQRSAAVKERWQMYARRLKPLYEMKRGLMDQFRMDECGKRAYCEVEDGTIRTTRQANGEVQRRLSHQPSSASCNAPKSLDKLASSTQQRKQENGHNHKVLAMSSCPSSTVSSPSHSGVLAVHEPNQKMSAPKSASSSGRKASSKLTNHSRPCRSSTSVDGTSTITSSSKSSGSAPADCGNNYRSISTMHELHSALQSAIAHCKESNKKLNHAAN